MSREVKINWWRKHVFTGKVKALAADALARKVGYLRVEDLPGLSIFATLPRQHFNPKRIIRPKNSLCVVSGGLVQIRHSHHDFLIKELAPGTLFGDMPLLGQTMLASEAVAGAEGALISFMSVDTAREWVSSNPIEVLEKTGSRLALIDAEHYRAMFQLTDSKIAVFLFRACWRRSGDRRTDAHNDRPPARDVPRDRDERTRRHETRQDH